MLLPWQHCHARCHDRIVLGAHECHPDGCCPEQPDGESRSCDDPLSFDTVRPSPEPAVPPPPVIPPFLASAAPAPPDVAPAPDVRPSVPRTTALLL